MRTNYQLPRDGTPPSRRRSLVRDLSNGLRQQMYLWGCDVRRKEGNLLEGFGMQRIGQERKERQEGTSRYRAAWEGGVVELHGFCAGWYPQNPEARGVVFIRHRDRLDVCDGAEPVTPGVYGESGLGAGRDTLAEAVMPFVRWLVAYESWVFRTTEDGYRYACWLEYLGLVGARPWLPPDEALRWLAQFAQAPDSVPRARASLRKLSPRIKRHY
jgi:hypothetical protein